MHKNVRTLLIMNILKTLVAALEYQTVSHISITKRVITDFSVHKMQTEMERKRRQTALQAHCSAF